jgi:uncharacterized protein (DUF427 family)
MIETTAHNDRAAPMRIVANPNRVRVMFAGHVIADTADALTVHEQGHAPVQYFPRKDVEMAFMGRTARHTHCPLKGEASYFTLAMDARIIENAVWTYENPLPGAEALKDYVAFYPQNVEIYALTPAEEALEPRAAHTHGV